MEDTILKVASWGKYVYRADTEYRNFNLYVQNSDEGIKYFVYGSQFLASMYVVIEGWQSLKQSDARIDKLLSVYDDYVLTTKRCRNAVYHYQESILDKRVENAVCNTDLITWAGALLDEIVRFLYTFPIYRYGLCSESLNLQEEYFDLIGWTPEREPLSTWFKTLIDVFRYAEVKSSDELEWDIESDRKTNIILKKLMTEEINPYYLLLSRL